MDYKGVLGEFQTEYTVSRSKFITTVSTAENAERAQEFIKEVSKRYSDATHNCYAYIVNPDAPEMKFSDDNEPQGTAGLPMLEVIKKRGLNCTVAVVTRYFGGVKLGTGGLQKAYTKAVADCLDRAIIAEFMLSDYFKITADYSMKGKIERVIDLNGGEIADIIYSNSVDIIYAVPVGLSDNMNKEICSATSGQIKAELLYTKYFIYK